MRLVALALLSACSGDVTVTDRVALALDGSGAALQLAATLTHGEPCAALLAGGAALHGAAVGARTRSLPALQVDFGACGEVDAVRVGCELRSWSEAGTVYAAGLTAGVMAGAAGEPVSVAAVRVGACP